jgi:porphobilinogen synthase
MGFPAYRPRRLRKNGRLRGLIQEVELSRQHLVYPLFVKEMTEERVEIPSMPDVYQFSIDGILKEMESIVQREIPAVLLFGIPDKKDETGSGAADPDGVVQRTVRAIKNNFGNDILVITDLCLCEYTSHGHCGVVKDGQVDNDSTLAVLARAAVAQAEAGSDMIAPSDMMDGRVLAIRTQLDQVGFKDIPLMSYAAKYASALYGPFRDAAESAPQFGDRRGYQMDPPNGQEALREMELDVDEGADIIMVKPALFYLDIIRLAKDKINRPIAAYSVSGEYTMIKNTARAGYLDYRRTVMEAMTAVKRAGADILITYFAKDLAGWINE